jgi:hypothetical protein
MLSEQDIAIFDDYIDRFMLSDLSIVKIKDDNYPSNFLRKALQQRIKDRDLSNIIAYTFLSDLYLEKI